MERAVINSSKKNSISDKANVATVKTYLVSGKIKLTTGKAKNANIYTADKTTELTFKNLVVKSQDEDKNKTNAVTLVTSVNLIETEAEIKLFGYAPITLKGNHAGVSRRWIPAFVGQSRRRKNRRFRTWFYPTSRAGD